ncbi:MAG: sialidase family protein [Candidatus Korobacteraceae bacterium]
MKRYSRFAICALTVALCAFAVPAMAQMTSVGIDCSQISQYHLMAQENFRAGAALIECGVVKGGGTASQREEEDNYPQPPNVLVSNRTCTSDTTCTKSESMVWASPNGQTIVTNYNDHNTAYNNTYAGLSYSTNGGATFTEIEPDPLANGHSQNYGDPIVVYNQKLGLWFAGDLVTGCGGQGVGLWTSPDGITWTTGACAHNGSFDDRESFWVDNDPTSAGYGRMYVSWNDFNYTCGAGGCLFVTYSDNGTTWSTPLQLNSGTFFRNVQITGAQVSPTANRAALKGYDSVFVASMDEGGGGAATRQNLMFRSNNGGTSWTQVTMGPRFNPVGDSACGYFYQVNPIIRHMGWGEPAVGPNNIVHYVYAGAGTNNDHGDIFYTRSTDNGSTWSTPVELNTDPDQQYHEQWMPSLSVTPGGQLTASWYDRRQASTACNTYTDVGCSYNRYARQSPDNGVTWGTDFQVTSSLSPQPSQLDSGVVSCYAGDYDYNTARGSTAYSTWTDGRRSINGVAVQDVNFAPIPED